MWSHFVSESRRWGKCEGQNQVRRTRGREKCHEGSGSGSSRRRQLLRDAVFCGGPART